MPDEPASFRAWLAAAREEAGLSQQAVAEAVGVRKQQIQKIESGTRNAPFALAVRAAVFLGFDAWSVVDQFALVPQDVVELLIRSAREGPASQLPLD